jgi:hypothetical protein
MLWEGKVVSLNASWEYRKNRKELKKICDILVFLLVFEDRNFEISFFLFFFLYYDNNNSTMLNKGSCCL